MTDPPSPGTPIAALAESEQDVPGVAAAARHRLAGIRSVYDDDGAAGSLQLLEWQSYLKEGGDGAGGCGCG